MHEGRFQAALELSKELFKQQPTSAHRELVQSCYLGRARELRTRGMTRDAAAVLQTALQFDATSQSPAWLEKIAEELAQCGQTAQVLPLLNRVAEESRPRLLARLADAAVQQEAAGRNLLPEALRPEFDRVLQAFTQLHAGQDEAVRETLQAIGLKSPFLEWKLLLRGLQAFYLNDNVRAQENWQRLDSSRFPVRLAAPYRFQIDPAFRGAQSPEAQRLLQRQADALEGPNLIQDLRRLQAEMAREDKLPSAYRQAEALLPRLRQESPQLVPRLARCFYWSIVHHGQPEDVTRHQRVFGSPPDDPQFDRLRAMVMEQMRDLEGAHQAWQEFEKLVGKQPAAWPGEQGPRVRALVWLHMGQNAAARDDDRMDHILDLPDFLRRHPARPKQLKPSADACFQKAIDLAPDLLEAHLALFRYHRDREEAKPAEKAARDLLKHFPDHAETLEGLGDLLLNKGDHDEAIATFQRLIQVNPLEKRPPELLSRAYLFRARARAEAKRFDDARADFQTALTMSRGEKYPVWCKWAACEFKAANAERAEELLHQALGEAGSKLAVTFSMLIETIRLKLPPKLKKRFNDDFNAALTEPAEAASAAAILNTMTVHKLAGITYHGQKTHETKVMKYIGKAAAADFTEEQLISVCRDLVQLKKSRVLAEFARLGAKKFPNNPYFLLFQADSQMLPENRYGPSPFHIGPLLDKAMKLAEAMPRDPKQQELIKLIQEKQNALRDVNPFFEMFSGGFGGFGGFEDDFEDDDDDEDGW